ncbi:MAG: ComEC/Rec2 family competence protein [Verrucomicrobiota bacterium]
MTWQPTQLFRASFQLSFFVVLSIALIVPPLEKVRQKLLAPDPLLPPELRPRWKRWLDWPIRVVTTSLATSVAAWLGSMPLIAYYFYMITPGSLLANLVIVPLSSLALMSSLGSLVCGGWCPFLTELFNHSSWLWMDLMIRLSAWFASLPGAYFNVRQPGWTGFVIYYALLTGLLSGYLLAPGRRVWSGMGVLLVLVVWLVRWEVERVKTVLTVLPVRAGVIFVDAPGSSEDLLIDCGDAAAGDSMVKPFLRSQGVNRMAGLLLTHGDLAHAGGTETITSRFGIRQILTGPARARSPAYRQLLDRLERTPGKCRIVQRGSQLCGWNILHPKAQDRFARGDDGDLVLRRQFQGTRVLFLSDLGRLGQRTLLERETNLRADILVAGLSNKDFVSDALLDAVQPRLLIIASAEYPVANRPSRQLRDRLDRRNTPIVYTSEAGAAIVRFGPKSWQIKTMDGRHAQAEALEAYVPQNPASNEDSGGEEMRSEPDG